MPISFSLISLENLSDLTFIVAILCPQFYSKGTSISFDAVYKCYLL